MNFLNYTDQQIEDLVNNVYNGSISRDVLPFGLYETIRKRLNNGVFEGFGGTYANYSEDTEEGLVMAGFEKNIAVFSGAKTFQQINDMSNFLFDEKGDKLPFGEFKKHADEIFDQYNNNWLRTEYNTAISQASSGSRWVNIKEQAEIFPLIRFVTVGDGRVRPEHKAFDGIVKPVNDPFWKHNFPPLNFNCRCVDEQLEEGEAEITDTSALDLPEIPPLFQMNAGEDKIIFDESVHPYFKVDQRYKVALKNNFDLPFVPEVKPKGVKPTPAPAKIKTTKPAPPKQVEFTAEMAADKIKNLPEIKQAAEIDLQVVAQRVTVRALAKELEVLNWQKQPELWSAKVKEYNAAAKEVNTMVAKKATILKKAQGTIIDVLKVDNPLDLTFNSLAGSLEKRPRIIEGLNQINKIVSKKWQTGETTVNVLVKNRVRANYVDKASRVTLSPSDGVETMVHEVGHFLEHKNPELHRRIMKFYDQRTANDVVEQLSKVTGNRGYGYSEVTKKDGFVDPYIGKYYNRQGSSEILTMWFTEVLTNPTRLFDKDFDYFKFIFNLIREK